MLVPTKSRLVDGPRGSWNVVVLRVGGVTTVNLAEEGAFATAELPVQPSAGGRMQV